MAKRKYQLAFQALNGFSSKEYTHRLPLETAMEQITKADEPLGFSNIGPQEMLSQKNNIGGAVRSLVPPFHVQMFFYPI